MIVGIDEVGRGPWAGPVVMGAVVLGPADIAGLTDSKKLSAKKRTILAERIHTEAAAVGLGWVHADELDTIGLSKSLELACRRALEEIRVPYTEIIIDGTVNFLQNTGKGAYVTTMKKADLLIQSVSAASIVAKVARDDWMTAQDQVYPGYAFSSHVGYGTAAHKAALYKLGITPLHRKSFAPIAAMLPPPRAVVTAAVPATSTREIGNAGETVAATYLEHNGFVIRARNWRTKWCEIDIVAEKDAVYYFVEVKHRANNAAGGGAGAITAKKQSQMRFAARLYMAKYAARSDARLYVIITIGTQPTVESAFEIA